MTITALFDLSSDYSAALGLSIIQRLCLNFLFSLSYFFFVTTPMILVVEHDHSWIEFEAGIQGPANGIEQKCLKHDSTILSEFPVEWLMLHLTSLNSKPKSFPQSSREPPIRSRYQIIIMGPCSDRNEPMEGIDVEGGKLGRELICAGRSIPNRDRDPASFPQEEAVPSKSLQPDDFTRPPGTEAHGCFLLASATLAR